MSGTKMVDLASAKDLKGFRDAAHASMGSRLESAVRGIQAEVKKNFWSNAKR